MQRKPKSAFNGKFYVLELGIKSKIFKLKQLINLMITISCIYMLMGFLFSVSLELKRSSEGLLQASAH